MVIIHSAEHDGTAWSVVATVTAPSGTRAGSLSIDAPADAAPDTLAQAVAAAYGLTLPAPKP